MRSGIESATVDAEEIARFDALSAGWWDPRGKLRPLHMMNATRIQFIRDCLVSHFARAREPRRPLSGLRVLDIGCGGGLAAEPLARLGAAVVGIDAARGNIEVASAHATAAGLAIEYRAVTADVLLRAGERFDVVLALEVVEHVADVDAFVGECCSLVETGGILILSTLNRTLKSLLLGKIGAEYVLRWLPAGTHDWRRFMTPKQITSRLAGHGFLPGQMSGVVYSPLTDEWLLSRDVDVNYILAATKPGAVPSAG